MKRTGNGQETDREWTGNGQEMGRKWAGNGQETGRERTVKDVERKTNFQLDDI
ncbi:MAG: hypothetical protein IKB34_09295 [Clostridia bacterium]|nr:hypothetical protein [Clostridia bacterium]